MEKYHPVFIESQNYFRQIMIQKLFLNQLINKNNKNQVGLFLEEPTNNMQVDELKNHYQIKVCRKDFDWDREDFPFNEYGKVDLFISGNCMQSIRCQEAFVRKIRFCMNKEACLGIHLPDYSAMKAVELILNTGKELCASNEEWESILDTLPYTLSFFEYYNLLSRYFPVCQVEILTKGEQLESAMDILLFFEELIQPIQLFLGNEKTQKFHERVEEQLRREYPDCENGKILFSYSHFFLFAQK